MKYLYMYPELEKYDIQVNEIEEIKKDIEMIKKEIAELKKSH